MNTLANSYSEKKQYQAVCYDGDVVLSRQMGRSMAEGLGFCRSDQALIATAISELARNIVSYAGTGRIEAYPVQDKNRVGIQVISTDTGPGIHDIETAMIDGFSTGQSLGLGLPGTKRIVDEFDIVSPASGGLKITITKWKRR